MTSTFTPTVPILHLLILLSSFLCISTEGIPLSLRPPATPLIVQSPYLSVWSPADHLYDTSTLHWSGASSTLTGLIVVDNQPFVWMGPAKSIGYPTVTQIGNPIVYPTQTLYIFSVAEKIYFNVTFSTPSIPSNLTLITQPATFITVSVQSIDNQAHPVAVYFDFDATLVTNNTYANSTLVTWLRIDDTLNSSGISGVRIGAQVQYPLNPIVCGQSEPLTGSQTIVWGWAYLLVTNDNNNNNNNSESSTTITTQTSVGSTVNARKQFATTGSLPPDDTLPPKAVGDGFPGASVVWNFGTVPPSSTPVTSYATFFMDEILAGSFYVNNTAWNNNPASTVLVPYWRKDLPFNDTVGIPTNALITAHNGAIDTLVLTTMFDNDIYDRLVDSADENLATFASLIFRQVTAANIVSYHPILNQVWTIFKEIASGGDMSTMDVVYPASPLLSVLSPELLATSLIPLMQASFNTTIYNKAWVIHDIGKFPIADRPWGGQEDMPLEETANLLLMLAAIGYQQQGNTSWLEPYFQAEGGMNRWSQFLFTTLPFPERQGTTDDFLGSTSNGTNLVWKGAAGLAAYGYLQYQRGNTTGADTAWTYAGYSAALMCEYGWYGSNPDANDSRSHFVWGYGYNENNGNNMCNSTFLMYNAMWATALRMYNLLPNQTAYLNGQANFYDTFQYEEYGIPLINGSLGTKGDWLSYWAAALYSVPNSTQPVPQPHPQSLSIYASLVRAANTTTARTPMTDFWSIKDASYGGKYRGRPVLGGTFAPLIVSELAKLPTMPHEQPMAEAFEKGHAQAFAEIRQRKNR